MSFQNISPAVSAGPQAVGSPEGVEDRPHAIIDGTEGPDNLNDTSGGDTIDAKGGDDTITVSEGGSDAVDGGPGSDRLILDARVRGGAVQMDPLIADPDGLVGVVSWNSTTVSFQHVEHFTIHSSTGNHQDVVATGGGDDVFYHYGLNSDTYLRDDIDLGGGSNDLVVGDFSAVTSYAVTTQSEAGWDFGFFVGGNGKARITGAERLHFIGGTQGDNVTGLVGNDILEGRAGNDYLNGGDGNDDIRGGTGNNWINAGTGDDATTSVRFGVDTINGGDGIDTAIIDYSDLTGAVTTHIGAEATEGAEIAYTNGTVVWDHNNWSGTETGVRVYNVEKINITTGSGADNITTLGGDDVIRTNDGDDTVNAGGGNDIVEGGDGNNILNGGDGTDTVSYSAAASGVTVDLGNAGAQNTGGAGTDTLSNFENLTGSDHNDVLTGDAAANVIAGGAGDDTINGGAGADTLQGGSGNDTYIDNDSDADTISEASEGGTDTVRTNQASYSLAGIANVENLTGTSSAGQTLTGNDEDNVITGSSGADTLNGGDGADWLYGNDGNDTVNGGDGTDTMYAGRGNDTLNGGADDDTMYGGEGNDTLDGGTGADYMEGFTGDDIYYVDHSGDSVNEQAVHTVFIEMFPGFFIPFETPGGTDEVRTGLATYTLPANVENLTGTSSSGQTLTGNSQANTINGGSGDDVLHGAAGNDTINGNDGNDSVEGGEGDDILDGGNGTDTASYASATSGVVVSLALSTPQNTVGAGTDTLSNFENIRGSAHHDHLIGDSSANALIGGGGNDTMVGGAGDDTYYVDTANDAVSEFVGEGRDRVAASVSYTLGAGSEIEILEVEHSTWTDAIDLTGNGFDNAIAGNAGVNVLRGLGGNDVLAGLGGDDVLVGGDGDDVMDGGSGNDNIYVDDAGDVVIEATGGGNDRVAASVSYVLSPDAEVELIEVKELTSTNAINLTGSNTANTIYGNNGQNFLDGSGGDDVLFGLDGNDYLIGGSGNDTMWGGTGDDTYYVADAGDAVREWGGEGRDRVAASVSYTLTASSEIEILEAITLSDTTAMDLTGNEFAQLIQGNAGVNILDGKGGNDILAGDGGADSFAFTTALGSNNVDHIDDFETAHDNILLGAAGGQPFAGLQGGTLSPDAFAAGSEATSSSHRIIYNPETGAIYYDSDGAGGNAAVQFATVKPGTALTANHFVVTGAPQPVTVQQSVGSTGFKADRYEEDSMQPGQSADDMALPSMDYFMG